MPTQGPLVLVVEDDLQIARFVRASLTSRGYRVHEVATGHAGLAQAAARLPDLVLLDLGLPDLDGHEVLRRLRRWATLPVVVLTARSGDDDKVRALDGGADDYLTKPFSVDELLAPIRVALRHAASRETARADEPVFVSGDLRVDLAKREIFVGERSVRLTPTEYRVLAVLVRNAGRVVTHRELLQAVWGPGRLDQAHYVPVFISQMRRKLERDPARPQVLLSEPGVGYRIKIPEGRPR